MTRLFELCLPTETVDPTKSPQLEFRYVDISSVDNRMKRIVGAQALLGSKAPSRARNRIQAGDIILSTTRPNLNAVAMVPPELNGQVCSTGFCVLRAGPELDRDFLFLCLQRKEFVGALVDLVKGALYPAVSDRQVFAQSIPLPDLPTQRRIAARLKEQMAGVEAARKAVEEQQAALAKLNAACLREAFAVNSENWPTKPLVDICEIQLGKMLSSKSRTGKSPALYLRNQNVQWGRFDLRSIASMDFSPQERIKFALQPGDLMVCEGGEPGRAAVWNGEIENCFYQKALFRLRPINGGADPFYLLYRLQFGAFTGEFADSNAKSTIAHLPAVRLAKLAIPLPDIQTQREMAARLRERLDQINTAKRVLEEQMEAVSALPAAYLRAAFEGIE